MAKKEGFVTLAEVKEILEKEAKNRELSTEQKYALEHVQRFARIDSKKAVKLMKELMDEVDVLTEPVAVKLADLMPTDPEDVRIVFAKERVNIQKKDIEKILGIVEKYG